MPEDRSLQDSVCIKKIQKLEVLSVVGIVGVTDEFASELLAYLGCDLKDISLFGCGKVVQFL